MSIQCKTVKLLLESLEDRITPSVLLPYPSRRDLVVDATRNLLYITTATGSLIRYDIGTQQALSPWQVGTQLRGADIAADGQSLYVARGTKLGNQLAVHQVNLNTGAVTDILFAARGYEAGVNDVVVASDSKAFAIPLGTYLAEHPALHELNLETGSTSLRLDTGDIFGGRSRLNRSEDRSFLFFHSMHVSTTYARQYETATDQIRELDLPYQTSTEDVSINRQGNMIAMEHYDRVNIFDRDYKAIQTIRLEPSAQPAVPADEFPRLSGGVYGVTFDPNQDVLYIANAYTDTVTAYSTTTWARLFQVPIGEDVPDLDSASEALIGGDLVVSPASDYLFLTTPQGVRSIALPTAAGPAVRFRIDGMPRVLPGGTLASVRIVAEDAFGQVATGYNGTVHFSSSSLGQLPADYTFVAADAGEHSFTVRLDALGLQSLRVEDVHSASLSGELTGIEVHGGSVPLLPVQQRSDHVFDADRGILYVTTKDGWVERYVVATGTLLSPWKVGNILAGLDLSPDGSKLYVCEQADNATQSAVYQVDTATGAKQTIWYDQAEGSWDIAITTTGQGLLSVSGGIDFYGAWPLFEIDSLTGVIRRQSQPAFYNSVAWDKTALSGSFDRTTIVGGALFQFEAPTDSYVHSDSLYRTFTNRGIINHSKRIFAVPTETEVLILDQLFQTIQTLPFVNASLAFAPFSDVLYVADATTNSIYAFDTNNWSQIASYSLPDHLSNSIVSGYPSNTSMASGEITITPDERNLFISTDHGVSIVPLNQNALPSLRVSNAVVNEKSKTAQLTVSLSAPTTQAVTVQYSTRDGSALQGVDYLAMSGTVTFAPGQRTRTITIPLLDDVFAEEAQVFSVALRSPVRAVLADPFGYVTIQPDGDTQVGVRFTVPAARMVERYESDFAEVLLTAPSTQQVTVNYELVGGTAQENRDYTFQAGTLTFEPGETRKFVAINVLNNGVVDTTRTVQIRLTQPVGARLAQPSTHTLSILDDIDPVSIFFERDASSFSEGTQPVINIRLGQAQTIPVSVMVNYYLPPWYEDDVDFSALSEPIVFQPGETVKRLPIRVINDRLDEENETIRFELSDPQGLPLTGNYFHEFTIVDNDLPPVVQWGTARRVITEQNQVLRIPVTLSGPSSYPISVGVALLPTTTASLYSDFFSYQTAVDFQPGETVSYYDLELYDDRVFERTEQLHLGLAGATQTVVGMRNLFRVTILDNDPRPTAGFAVQANRVAENVGTVEVVVRMSLAAEERISYRLTALPFSSAVANRDYVIQSPVVVFEPGEVEVTVLVTIVDNSIRNLDRMLFLGLTPLSPFGIGPLHMHRLIIENDDV